MPNWITIFIVFIIIGIHSVVTNDVINNYEKRLKITEYRLKQERLYSSGLEGMVIGLHSLLQGYRISSELKVEMTAYTARPEETNADYMNTALLQEPVPGWSIAVSQDLSYLLGKRVYIKGYGVRYVNDLMNKRYTKRIDILVSDVETAKKIGLQKDIIIVLIEPVEALKDIINGEF